MCAYVRWTKRARASQYENRLPNAWRLVCVAAHSRETHFEHSFPDGSPRSLFHEISLPIVSAAFYDKVETRRNDTYTSQKDVQERRKGKVFTTWFVQLTLNVKKKVE